MKWKSRWNCLIKSCRSSRRSRRTRQLPTSRRVRHKAINQKTMATWAWMEEGKNRLFDSARASDCVGNAAAIVLMKLFLIIDGGYSQITWEEGQQWRRDGAAVASDENQTVSMARALKSGSQKCLQGIDLMKVDEFHLNCDFWSRRHSSGSLESH